MATHVTARLSNARRGNVPRGDSASIGKAGEDEYYIKTGQAETFEGGHLIPHWVFDSRDALRDMAGDWRNIVPMSRHVNIAGWADKEAEIRRRYNLLKDDEELEVDIPVNRRYYSRRVSTLANRFGLTYDDDYEDEAVTLYSWIPRSIGPVTMKRLDVEMDTESEEEYEKVKDAPIRREHEEITTGDELVRRLLKQGMNVSPELLEQLRNL